MCGVIFGPASQAASISPTTIPSPRPAGWVVDQAGLLSPDDIAALDSLAEAVHQRAGAEMAIVTIRSTGGVDARNFATDLFNRWGIGARGQNNGLLLFVAIDDRAAEIILGAGIDSDAEVAASERIMQEVIVPRFRAGERTDAILSGARECAERFFGASAAGAPAPVAETTPVEAATSARATVARRESERADRGSTDGVGWGIGAAGTGLLGGAAWLIGRVFVRRRPRRCRTCSMTMLKLDEASDDAHLEAGERVEERIGSVDYDVWQCPGCGTVDKVRYGRWFSRFSRCPTCGVVTKNKTQQTLRTATTATTGLVEVHERCANCSYENTYRQTIPRVSTSTSKSSSGFSGGRSSGRGASGRW